MGCTWLPFPLLCAISCLALLAHRAGLAAGTAKGALGLDALTFDKIVDGSRHVLVKFDKQYPYGDEEDAFKAVAEAVSGVQGLLVAEIGIQDYGDKLNDDLRQRFGVPTDSFPAYKLFRKGTTADSPIAHSGQVTKDALLHFLRTETGVYIGQPGCLEAFDALATKLCAGTSTPEEAQSAADALHTSPEDEQSAKIYRAIFKKIREKGRGFAATEAQRVRKLLSGKVSQSKVAMLNLRLTILSSFFPCGPAKEEL